MNLGYGRDPQAPWSNKQHRTSQFRRCRCRFHAEDQPSERLSGVPARIIGLLAVTNDPYSLQVKVILQLLTASFIDQVAVRKDLAEEATGNKLSTSKGVPYRAAGIEEDVFIHPSSVLYSVSPPQYLVYHEVVRSNRVWLKGDGSFSETWRGCATLTFRCRVNSDQPILDSPSREVSLYLLKSHQKQRWGHDGHPSIRSWLGTSPSESRFYLVSAMDTSCISICSIMRGKYCRGLECRVCADKEVAEAMNRGIPGYTSSLMSSLARSRSICVRKWPLQGGQ